MDKQTQKSLFILQFCEQLSPEMFQHLGSEALSSQTYYERLGIFAGLHRQYSDEIPKVSLSRQDEWEAQFSFQYPDFWTFTEWARLCFLMKVHEADSEFLSEDTVNSIIRRGDHSEQISLARILFYLPEAERFQQPAQLWLATNSSEIFKSLSMKNPYPMSYFTDLFFRQMVLKALFIDLPTEPIWGLKTRFDSELHRMSMDYQRERRIANRKAPQGAKNLNLLGETLNLTSTIKGAIL